MDAISELRQSLDPNTVEAMPLALRIRLDIALRHSKQNTLHSYAHWSDWPP